MRVAEVVGREAFALVGGNIEAGVAHAEGRVDVVAIEVGQRLAGEFLDDVTLNVHGVGVEPAFAGLVEQRDGGQLVDHLLEVGRLHDLEVVVHGVGWRFAATVAEAGGVSEQLAHGGGVIGVDEDGFAVGIDALLHLEVGELRNVLRYGVVGEPLALLVEDHHGDTGGGLGHGVVAEDGVFGHGRGGGEIAVAVGAVLDDFAVAGEDGDGADEVFLIDLILNEFVEVFEALG